MHITYDYKYVNHKMIAMGLATKGVYSLNFDRYYTEEEKAENKRQARELSREEWDIKCDKIGEELCQRMEKMMEVLKEKYKIFQYRNSVVPYGEHDLYFYSNLGWISRKWFDQIQLTFNENRTVTEKLELMNEVLNILEPMELRNISCRVQYETVFDDKQIGNEAERIFEDLKGKFVKYNGMIGKIRQVNNGYGFFKKNARSKYTAVNSAEIIIGAVSLV